MPWRSREECLEMKECTSLNYSDIGGQCMLYMESDEHVYEFVDDKTMVYYMKVIYYMCCCDRLIICIFAWSGVCMVHV